jgi:hypothetical protein
MADSNAYHFPYEKRTSSVKSSKNEGIDFFKNSVNEPLLKAKKECKYGLVRFYVAGRGSCTS